MRIGFAVRSLLFALAVLAFSSASFGQIGVAVSFGPPALPVYDQPLCPGDGYLWTPGYWAFDYDINDYYWVPGNMGSGSRSRLPLDASILGLGRRWIYVLRRLLGTRNRFLWRHQLRIRLFRRRLCRRTLG